MKRVLVRVAVVLLVLVALDQLALLAFLGDGTLLGRRIAPFDPPIFSPSQEASLARIRAHLETGEASFEELRFDTELGWCPPPDTGQYDWAGCRSATPLARVKPPGVRRAVAIGGSFTHGDEVPPARTWCAQADAARADLEVANLGVSAYGIDQAYLRLKRDGAALEPDEVWLGFLPAAALRPTTLYRPALRHWSQGVVFKPRLRLAADGSLELVPNPAKDLEHVTRMMSSQTAFLAAVGDGDPWVSRVTAAYAPQGSSPWHHSFVGRLALTAAEARGRDVAPWLNDEDGDVFRLLVAIVEATRAEAERQGAAFRLVVVPGRRDLEQRERDGAPYWGLLTERLAAAGVDVIDCSDALARAGAPRRDELFMPGGHYSPEGNGVVAAALLERLD